MTRKISWKLHETKNLEELEVTIGNVVVGITRDEDYNKAAGFEKGSWDTTWSQKGNPGRVVYGSEVTTDLEEAKKYALSKVEEMKKRFTAKPKRTRRPKGPGISYSIYD